MPPRLSLSFKQVSCFRPGSQVEVRAVMADWVWCLAQIYLMVFHLHLFSTFFLFLPFLPFVLAKIPRLIVFCTYGLDYTRILSDRQITLLCQFIHLRLYFSIFFQISPDSKCRNCTLDGFSLNPQCIGQKKHSNTYYMKFYILIYYSFLPQRITYLIFFKKILDI